MARAESGAKRPVSFWSADHERISKAAAETEPHQQAILGRRETSRVDAAAMCGLRSLHLLSAVAMSGMLQRSARMAQVQWAWEGLQLYRREARIEPRVRRRPICAGDRAVG